MFKNLQNMTLNNVYPASLCHRRNEKDISFVTQATPLYGQEFKVTRQHTFFRAILTFSGSSGIEYSRMNFTTKVMFCKERNNEVVKERIVSSLVSNKPQCP